MLHSQKTKAQRDLFGSIYCHTVPIAFISYDTASSLSTIGSVSILKCGPDPFFIEMNRYAVPSIGRYECSLEKENIEPFSKLLRQVLGER